MIKHIRYFILEFLSFVLVFIILSYIPKEEKAYGDPGSTYTKVVYKNIINDQYVIRSYFETNPLEKKPSLDSILSNLFHSHLFFVIGFFTVILFINIFFFSTSKHIVSYKSLS